jgi:predicted dehydrogenase
VIVGDYDVRSNQMTKYNRREFLDHSKTTGLAVAAGVTILADAQSAKAAPANEKIVMGVMGIRGRGYPLMMGFAQRPDCEIAYLADVNTSLFDAMPPSGYQKQVPPEIRGTRAESIIKAQGRAPECVQDFRRILDDDKVDALVIATPEHWHALATVWGCQAGKDVYVEKPPTHTLWEGDKMVEAARKYDRIVQVGTQSRSAPYLIAARQYIESGKLGRIHLCRVVNMKYGSNFEMGQQRYNSTLHRRWNYFWRYGSGDLGGDGIHQIDLARWLCGVSRPKSVYANGGVFDSEGAAETPDTVVSTLEFDGLIMTFEATLYTSYMLKTDGVIRQSDMFPYWPQNATHFEIYGSEGVMCVGRHGGGWQVFVRPKDRQPVVRDQMYGRFPDPEHQENFVQCMRRRTLPNADVEDGQLSMALVHYTNISLRLGGQKLVVDRTNGTIQNSPEAMALFKQPQRDPWVIPEKV